MEQFIFIKSLATRIESGLARTARLGSLFDLGVCFALAILALGFFYVDGWTPDSRRFVDQSVSILAGEGFRTKGLLDTWLPPGYPIFIASLEQIGLGAHLKSAQILMHFLSILVVYVTALKYSRGAALLVASVLAVSPLVSMLTGCVLSETFGMFLCASLCFIFTRLASTACWAAPITLGATASALLLTSPATIFLCFGLCCVALYQLLIRRAFGSVVCLLIGGLIPMVPWQHHCYKATDSLCVLVFSRSPITTLSTPRSDENLVYPWFRTWSLGERHLDVLFRNNPGAAPSWAFHNPEAREAFPSAEVRLDRGLSVAQKNAIAHDLENKGGLPRFLTVSLVRAVGLWVDMPQFGHAQVEYVLPFGLAKVAEIPVGTRTVQRTLKMVFSSITFLAYLMIPILFVTLLSRAYRKDRLSVCVIALSVFLYTGITALTAYNESRRNVVFYPAMLLVVALTFNRYRFEKCGLPEVDERGARL